MENKMTKSLKKCDILIFIRFFGSIYISFDYLEAGSETGPVCVPTELGVPQRSPAQLHPVPASPQSSYSCKSVQILGKCTGRVWTKLRSTLRYWSDYIMPDPPHLCGQDKHFWKLLHRLQSKFSIHRQIKTLDGQRPLFLRYF